VKRFLTQALVDHMSAAKHRIRHHGDWHARIWQAFQPIEGDRGPRGFLYAVEETSQGFKVLILSESVPTRPDWCPVQGWATKVVPEGFLRHRRYTFGLTANPTIDRSHGPRVSLAKRVGPNDDPELRLLEWLERKGMQGGFRIYRGKTSVIPGEVQTFPTSDRRQQVTLHYVCYRGVLEVTDSKLFETTFINGIGRARGFGCGTSLKTYSIISPHTWGCTVCVQSDGQSYSHFRLTRGSNLTNNYACIRTT
jgi:CRISPR system Cascade subunit CasE